MPRPRLSRRLRYAPRPLLAILAVGAVCAFSWSLALPAIQAPDELAHVLYTQLLVERGELPKDSESGERRPTELEPAAYWDALNTLVAAPDSRPGWTDLEQERWREAARQLPPDARSDLGTVNPAGNNPPLYYAYEAVPYLLAYSGSIFDRIYAMRIGSIVLYLVTIVLAWALAGELLGAALWPRTLAAGLVALQPMLVQMGSVVNPDILLTALWTAAIYLAVLIVRRGPSPRLVIGILAVSLAAVLTQPRGLPVLAPVLAAIAIGFWRRSERPLPRVESRRVWLALGGGALLALVALALGLGALAPAGAVAGITHPFSLREFGSYVWQFYLPALPFQQAPIGPDDFGWQQTFVKFLWGAFAWQEVTFPRAVYIVLEWLSVAGLAALVAALLVRRSELRRRWGVLTVLALFVLSLVAALHVAAYYVILSDPQSGFIVGRYVLPLIALFGCAVAFVVASLPRRIVPYAAGAVLAGAVLLQLAALGVTVARFYA